MKVSVVIPTMLRPELVEAVASVRGQDLVDAAVEIVVVADRLRTELNESAKTALKDVDQVLFTGGKAGAPAARNLGVDKSTGDWIAFLDDDDHWTPSKLSEQLEAARSLKEVTRDIVVSSRVRQWKGTTESLSAPVPSRCFQDGESVERYLFEGRSPSFGRSSIFTSTLFANIDLARKNRWDETLRRHQDWDWLIRAQRLGAHVQQLDSVLSFQRVGTTGSISASTNWRSSLDWARSWKDAWSEQTYVDFVAGQPLRYALQGRSLAGVRACIGEIVSQKRFPSVGPTMIGAAGLLSRSQLERMLVSSQSSRNGR